MIGRLEGRLHQVRPGEVVLQAGGVGYLVATTLRAFNDLAEAESVSLWVHTHVREDAIVLFGFPDRAELEAFQRLIAVAGVGPRTALAVLSAMTALDLAAAVEAGDTARLQRTPGVGRKTAERIVLELKGSLPGDHELRPDRRSDAVSALVNLGYGQRDAVRVVDHVLRKASSDDLGEVLRLALQRLTR